jgi:formylglycine-generating enzyme required for sulfatase activity
MIPPRAPGSGADRQSFLSAGTTSSSAHVAGPAFDVDVLPVTNAQFLEFVNAVATDASSCGATKAGTWIRPNEFAPSFLVTATHLDLRTSGVGLGPRNSRLARLAWRGMFEAAPLPADGPVYVSHAEASPTRTGRDAG